MPLFEKNIWKKSTKQYLYTNHPELVNHFTSKISDAACHYMAGYGESLEENANHPRNEEDMKRAVAEAGTAYAIKMMLANEV